jgi:GTP-binding protein
VAVADLPGLIEGSHRNKGLGIEFLRHVQRCAALILMVDVSGPTPWHDVMVLRDELACFSEGLATRPQLVVANKIDVPGAQVNCHQSFITSIYQPFVINWQNLLSHCEERELSKALQVCPSL